MENENEGVVIYNIEENTQKDFEQFAPKLEMLCPNINIEEKLKKMLGWE